MNGRAVGGIGLLSLGVLYLGFLADRTDFPALALAFSTAFLGYLLLITDERPERFRRLLQVGLGLRIALVFAFPLLSDDIYRFIWDGILIGAGINPFAELPSYYLEAGREVAGLTPRLFDQLNSPEYYTIYPPVAQFIFTLATQLGQGDWWSTALWMKIMLLGFEVGTLVCMLRIWPLLSAGEEKDGGAPALTAGEGRSFPAEWAILFYWLNPLVIVEICGNLHFEGVMIFFLLFSLYWLLRSGWWKAGLAMAFAVGSKLLPLLLLPHLLRRFFARGRRAFWIFSSVLGGGLLLLFAPLLAGGFLEGFGSSLDLYFRKFEFNASLYYLARAYGYYEVGWNQIARFGPLLAAAAAVGILLLALIDRRRDWRSLLEGWLFAFVLYLLCATTVHPWYLCVPIVLCCGTRWRFPLVWSFLICFTYGSYATEPYAEQLWVVGLEYVGVAGFFVWEVVRSSRRGDTGPIDSFRS